MMKERIRRLFSCFGKPENYPWSYDEYYLPPKELAVKLGIRLIIVWFVAYCFYDSLIMAALLSPAALVLLDAGRDDYRRARLFKFNEEFKDGIGFLASSLNAGYSVENAWRESSRQVYKLHGEDADISREFGFIAKRMEMNVPLGDLIYNLAERTGLEDVRMFAESFLIAKKTGGNMREIIGRTSDTIAGKTEVNRDIATMVAGKKMEQKIMTVVPLGIICFLKLSSPAFLSPMYHNPPGMIIMTVCLGVYAAAVRLSAKIMRIEV